MTKPLARLFRTLLAVPLLLSACDSQPAHDSIVLAPASMEDALGAVEKTWEADGNPPVAISFAGTSTNARQVEQGAPADLFLSADVEWIDRLTESGLIDAASVRDIAAGELVLIAPGAAGEQRTALTAADLSALLGDEGRLAVADMKAVPAGRYAAEALDWMAAEPGLRARAIETENVRGTLRLVETGEAAAGIVYATDAKISDAVHVVYRFPAEAHEPIRYVGGLIGKAPEKDARAFLAYLNGGRARAILARYGFLPPGRGE